MKKAKTQTDTLQIDDCWNQIGVWSKAAQRCSRLQQVIHCRNCSVYANYGRLLLDRDLPADYTEYWQDNYKKSKFGQEQGDQSAIVFRVGNEWLAMPLRLMDEITRMRKVHSIPHKRHQALRGLVNINGVLLVCVCLQQLLKIEDKPGEKPKPQLPDARMIVVRKGKNRYVVPVNETRNTIRYQQHELKEPPSTLSSSARVFIDGILVREGLSIGLVGSDVLFAELERSLL